MHDLIQRLLRKRLLEGRNASHTPANKFDTPEKRQLSTDDLDYIEDLVQWYDDKYGNDPYYNTLTEGDGVYYVLISKDGIIRTNNIKVPNHTFDPNDVGSPRTTGVQDNISVLIRGPRGGAKVARIRAYVVLGQYIVQKVRSQIEDAYIDPTEIHGQKTLKAAMKKSKEDEKKEKIAAAKSNSIKITPQQEKEALRNYARENNMSILDILQDNELKKQIFRDYLNTIRK